MEWSHIQAFLAMARHGSIGGAARELNFSHPKVLRRLRALENEIGQALFQRHSKGVRLTDVGGLTLAMAEEMDGLVLAIQRKVAADGAQLEGTLRIAAIDWFATYLLPPVLHELQRAYPRIVPKLMTDHCAFNLSRGEADVAFRAGPFQEPDVVQRRLMRMTYGLYAGSGVPDPVPGSGMGAALLLMDTSQYPYADVPWIQARLPHARVAFRGNNRELQARLCARGLGLAVLPTPVGARTPGLRRIDLGEELPSCEYWMGYHRDLRRSRSLRTLADIAARLLGEPLGRPDPRHAT